MNTNAFESWVMEDMLWWRCAVSSPTHEIECSTALQALFEHPIIKINDLTGIYASPLIELKVQEVLQQPKNDLRFVTSYETKKGKFSFQHRMRVYEENNQKWVFSECIDVTEMVLLEREIVDAKGRASLAQVYERQAFLEEQNRLIEESYQKQSRFLALLSHELRSPLLGMKSMVMHLKQVFSDNDYLVERLKIINLTTEQMTFLVNDILTYSQTEYDAIILHPKRFSLQQTFEYVKQLTKSIAADKEVFVSFVYIGEKDWVFGDSVRLAQILINLIVNAIKFTRVGGVTVEVKQQADDLFNFRVTDSGEGIPSEKLQEIFDPFVQFKTEGSTNALGSGLGLSVVKQLVDVMGGDISVTSKMGVGTTFKFALKLQVASDEIQVEPEEGEIIENQVDQLKQHQYRVLVVDDSKINRMVLTGFLNDLNCQVEEAADGQQAWELFEKQIFDFVFLDIQMPIMDGFEVMKLINQKRQKGLVKELKSVFAITAGGGEELIPKGQTLQSLGFEKWFVKPISQEQVIKLLTESDHKVVEPIEPVQQPIEQENGEEDAFVDEIVSIPAQFQPLIGSFAEELKQNLEEMREQINKQQWVELKAKAHYVKGNCMVFQLERWVEWLRSIERNLQSEQIDKNILIECLEKLEIALKYLENSLLKSDNESN